jgi:hypothetical protein
MENMMSTSALALAFTNAEELGAVRSTVAWTMHALDVRFGWNGTTQKDMKTTIKVLRERHAYVRDADNEPRLDEKGNKVKRSAVYARLSLVEGVCNFMVKHAEGLATELHVAAISGDVEVMRAAVETVAAMLTERAEGDSLDALAFYLANEKSKRAAAAEEAKSAEEKATENAAAMKAEAEAAEKAKEEAKEEATRPVCFGDVMTMLQTMDLTPAQVSVLAEFAASRMAEMVRETDAEQAEQAAA